jgi:hypothetical protein
MMAHRSTRLFFLLLTAALFALHFQLMPRVGHAADQRTVSATSVVHLHKGDCDGGCCRGTACCIQAALSPDAVLSSPPSPRFGVATQAAFPLLVLKPLCPPPKSAVV